MQGKVGDGVFIAGRAIKDAVFSRVGDKQTAKCVVAVAVESGRDGKIVNVVAWRVLAELASLVRKGDQVAVAGKIQQREYKGTLYTDLVADWLNVVRAEVAQPGADPFERQGFTEEQTEEGELPF